MVCGCVGVGNEDWDDHRGVGRMLSIIAPGGSPGGGLTWCVGVWVWGMRTGMIHRGGVGRILSIIAPGGSPGGEYGARCRRKLTRKGSGLRHAAWTSETAP